FSYLHSFPSRRSCDLKGLKAKYLLSCFWEGSEGSFLLWTFWHAVLGFFVLAKGREWESRVMVILLFVQAILVSLQLGIYIGDIRSEEHTSELQSRENL